MSAFGRAAIAELNRLISEGGCASQLGGLQSWMASQKFGRGYRQDLCDVFSSYI
jgi:hypothetical protein